MKRPLKILSASILLTVGLIAIIPAIDISSMLSVEVESDKALSLQTGTVNVDHRAKMTRSRRFANGRVHLVLPNDVNVCRTVIGFSGGPGKLKLKSVVYRKWCLVPFCLDAKSLIQTYKCGEGVGMALTSDGTVEVNLDKTDGYLLPTGKDEWRLDLKNRGLWFILLTALALTGGLFLLGMFARFDRDDCSMRKFLIDIFIVSALATIFLSVVVPLQVYIPSQHLFECTRGAMMLAIARSAIGVFAYFMVVLCIGRIGFGRLPAYIVLLLAISVYLECGVMSIGLPELDGNLTGFINHGRSCWNAMVWGIVLLGGFALYKKLKSYIHWIASALLVLILASVFDIKSNTGDRGTANSTTISPVSQDQVLESVALSSNKNTMVFILDALTTEVAEDVFAKDPALWKKFNGFVLFKNNVGMHICTELGIPGIFTGRYMSEYKSPGDYDRAVFGQDSVLSEYIRDDVPCFLDIGGFVHYSWTNKVKASPVNPVCPTQPECSSCSPLKLRMKDQQAWNVIELCRFKVVPFFLKYYAYGLSFRSWPTMQMTNEKSVYEKLKHMSIDSGFRETLHVYHTEGAHAPYLIDRYGDIASGDRICYDAVVEKGWFALSQLGGLLDDFKARGVYDNMFILVVADHGAALAKGNKKISAGQRSCSASRPHPMLFVKPRQAAGMPKTDARLTSHINIKKVLSQIHKRDLSERDVAEMVASDKSIYQEVENGSYINFVFHHDGSVSAEVDNKGK